MKLVKEFLYSYYLGERRHMEKVIFITSLMTFFRCIIYSIKWQIVYNEYTRCVESSNDDPYEGTNLVPA
jgi:hypothetical protein